MKLVTSFNQIRKNCETFESGWGGGDSRRIEYINYVKNGQVFFPYFDRGIIKFAPSRFVGYVDNSYEAHPRNEYKSGSETTPRITSILKKAGYETDKTSSKFADEIYLDFCNSRGILPSSRSRSYWLVEKIIEWVGVQVDHDDPVVPPEPTDEQIASCNNIRETERLAVIKARIGHGRFRNDVLKKYRRCSVTGLENENLLIASHILPWRYCWSNPNECLSPDNALLLSPHWDALFDKFLITFDDEGTLLFSDAVTDDDKRKLNLSDCKISLSGKQRKFMKFHRKKFDEKNKKFRGSP